MTADLPSSPSAQRNREPIAAVLRDVLPQAGVVLEIASGTGEHCEYLAAQFPGLRWQPSDGDAECLGWIGARQVCSGLANLLAPIHLDASSDRWPVQRADAILCINMVHISPWSATLGLMRGAGGLLDHGAPLILYGPYRQAEVPTAASNEAFDRSLRSRDSTWGLRTVEATCAAAAATGLHFEQVVPMPANNLTLVFRKT